MKTQEQAHFELCMLYSRRDVLAHEYARNPNMNPQLLADIWGKIYALRWVMGQNVQWGSTQPQEEKYLQLGVYALREYGDGEGGPCAAIYITEYEARLKSMNWPELTEERKANQSAVDGAFVEDYRGQWWGQKLACDRELQLREDYLELGIPIGEDSE